MAVGAGVAAVAGHGASHISSNVVLPFVSTNAGVDWQRPMATLQFINLIFDKIFFLHN